jgi:hypothetical protein
MKSRTLSGDWVLIPPDVAAEFAPLLMAAAAELSPDALEAAQRLDLLGAYFTNLSSVSTDVSKLDGPESNPAEWVTVNEATQILGTSSQAVTGRLRRGTLRGVQLADRSWRVYAAALTEGS